jgi:hypothetical protein
MMFTFGGIASLGAGDEEQRALDRLLSDSEIGRNADERTGRRV